MNLWPWQLNNLNIFLNILKDNRWHGDDSLSVSNKAPTLILFVWNIDCSTYQQQQQEQETADTINEREFVVSESTFIF